MAIPEKLLEGIDKLEPMPVTAQRLTAALRDPNISAAEIAKLVEHDQGVAATVIRTSNSALFAGRQPIESVHAAVVRLGTANLLSVVLDRHLKRMAVDAPLYDLRENDLWLHGAVACHAATEILKVRPKAGIPRSSPVAALLHDVGKLVMSRFMKADSRQLVTFARQEKVSFVEAERQVLGCDHAEVGAALARHWKFPEEITDAIAWHHSPSPSGPSPVVDAAVLANLVAKTVGTGLGAEGMNLDIDPGIRKRLGMEHVDFCRLVANTSIRLAELRQEHGLKV
ncbi:MAG: HDOD domain-containing protein [Deltaproteobacteria bacterium]|nr:HDOD domain-containing protein [Deltaproteobacteria bacterium]